MQNKIQEDSYKVKNQYAGRYTSQAINLLMKYTPHFQKKAIGQTDDQHNNALQPLYTFVTNPKKKITNDE